MARRRLLGEERFDIPYFTKFGQNRTPHPAALQSLLSRMPSQQARYRDSEALVRGVVDPRNWWEGVRHPIRSLEQTGAAYQRIWEHPIREFQNAPYSTAASLVPGFAALKLAHKNRARLIHEETGAVRLGGRWAPKNPKWEMESLNYGDEYLGWHGRPVVRSGSQSPIGGRQRRWAEELLDMDDAEFENALAAWEARQEDRAMDGLGKSDAQPGFRAYNIRDRANQGRIVGSITSARMGRDKTYISDVYVQPEYRKSPAILELLNVATSGGKRTPEGGIINPRLQKVFDRRFNPERTKALEAAAKVKKKMPPNPSMSKPVPKNETVALAIALHQERLRTTRERSRREVLLPYDQVEQRKAAEVARMARNLGLSHTPQSRAARRGGR